MLPCCSNIPTLQEQAADIPMQMVRSENDEPDGHIGFDEEQQTEDEGILSDDIRHDDSW